MRIIKNGLLILSIIMLVFMIFILLVSFSFDTMFYNKEDDSLIVLINQKKSSEYIYTKNNHKITGSIDIKNGKIIFSDNNSDEKDKIIATCTYDHKIKTMIITGTFNKSRYNKAKFKQIDSIFIYLKTIF